VGERDFNKEDEMKDLLITYVLIQKTR